MKNLLSMSTLGLLVLLCGRPARATVVFTLFDVGNDMVLTANGSANITGLVTVDSQPGVVVRQNPNGFQVVAGTEQNPPEFGEFVVVFGPQSIGDNSFQVAVPSTGSGDLVGIVAAAHAILDLPAGYVSGTHLSASDIFPNVHIADLYLTKGVYTWTFNSGANADTVVLYLGATPEPSSVLMGGMGVLALIGLNWRGRSRKTAAVRS